MGLSDGRKRFQTGLAVLIQYRRVTDTQPASQPPSQTRCRSKDTAYYIYVARKKGWMCRVVSVRQTPGSVPPFSSSSLQDRHAYIRLSNDVEITVKTIS